MSSDSDALAHGLSVPIAAGELGELVPAPPSFVECSNQFGFLNESFSYRVIAAGYPTPTYSLNASSAALPDGLTLASDGLISGTIAPTATVGEYGIIIDATNSEDTDVCNFSLAVYAAPVAPIIVAIDDQNVSIGQDVELTVSTSQGTPKMTWTEVGLPASLTIEPTEATSTKATISGVISAPEGVYNSTITVTNEVDSDDEAITWTVFADFWAPYTDIEARYDFTDLSTMYSSQAAQFDGTNYLEKDDGANQVTAYPLTIVGWFKTSTTGTAQTVAFVGDKDVGTDRCILYVGSTNKLRVRARSVGDSFVDAESVATCTDGNWHFGAGVLASDTSRTLYLDDAAGVPSSVPVSITATYDCTGVGVVVDAVPNWYMVGDIDNSAIFQAALTSGELGWLYNAGAGRTWNELNDSYTGQIEDRATAFVATSSQYLSNAAAGGVPAYPQSFAMWFKTTTTGSGGVVSSGGSLNNEHLVLINSGFLNARTYESGASSTASNAVIVNDGEWHLGVVVYESNVSRRVSVDGGAFGTTDTGDMTPQDATLISVGARSAALAYFDGVIDELMLFTEVLDATDAAELYAGGVGLLASDVFANGLPTSGKKPVNAWSLSVNTAGGPGKDVAGSIDLTPVNGPTDATGIIASFVPPDPSNCKGWWGLDEHSGTRMDQSGSSMHLVPGGTNPVVGVAGLVEGPAVPEDRATAFASASTQYMQEDTAAVTDYPYSMSIWFMTSDVANQKILWCGDGGLSNRDTYLFVSGGRVAAIIRDTVTAQGLTSVAYDYADGEWHHALGVFESGERVKVYVDDVPLIDDGDVAPAITATYTRTAIGRLSGSSPTQYFNGVADEAMIFHDVLDATDALELYNEGVGRLASDVFANGLPTSGKKPVNAWNLSSTNAGGDIGKDLAGTIDLTPVAGPTDAEGIPAGQYIGGLITRVVDQSGNNNDVIQADLNKRPQVVRVDDGTGYALQGDGVDDVLQSSAFSSALSQPTDIYVVADSTAAGTYVDGIAVGNKHETSRQAAVWRINAGASQDGGTPDNDLHVLLAGFDGASSALYVDGGTAAIQGDAGSHTMTGVTVFADYAGSVNLSGTYRQLVVHNSQSGRDAIGDKLASDQQLTWSPIT